MNKTFKLTDRPHDTILDTYDYLYGHLPNKEIIKGRPVTS